MVIVQAEKSYIYIYLALNDKETIGNNIYLFSKLNFTQIPFDYREQKVLERKEHSLFYPYCLYIKDCIKWGVNFHVCKKTGGEGSHEKEKTGDSLLQIFD